MEKLPQTNLKTVPVPGNSCIILLTIQIQWCHTIIRPQHYSSSLKNWLKYIMFQGHSLDDLLLSYPQSCSSSIPSNKYEKISNVICVDLVVSIFDQSIKTYFEVFLMLSLKKRNLRGHNSRDRQLRTSLWVLYGFATSCGSLYSNNSACVCVCI